ncbi:unnamed protein product [Brugia timori]|uniref:Uncharacterized protein n=1 Tax=Brugia timori TaxID=42155 RepID=A0A0R3R8T0_9BILA|nr:unnamed protein product [Brugia timori]
MERPTVMMSSREQMGPKHSPTKLYRLAHGQGGSSLRRDAENDGAGVRRRGVDARQLGFDQFGRFEKNRISNICFFMKLERKPGVLDATQKIHWHASLLQRARKSTKSLCAQQCHFTYAVSLSLNDRKAVGPLEGPRQCLPAKISDDARTARGIRARAEALRLEQERLFHPHGSADRDR